MNKQVDALEAEYRKCAKAFGMAVELGDAKATKKNYDKLLTIGPKLRAHGMQGEAVLRRLMRDRSDAIASWAATDSLPFAEAEGLAVLDAIGKKAGSIAFDAEMIAEQWRAGKLKIG